MLKETIYNKKKSFNYIIILSNSFEQVKIITNCKTVFFCYLLTIIFFASMASFQQLGKQDQFTW